MWTLPQRAVLLAFVICALVYFSVRLAVHHHFVNDPPPADGARARELVDRLDPNTASRGMLSAIPGVGETLAQSILDYREQFVRNHPEQQAFTRPADLRGVRGIGAAREESLQEYFVFPSTAAAPPVK